MARLPSLVVPKDCFHFSYEKYISTYLYTYVFMY